MRIKILLLLVTNMTLMCYKKERHETITTYKIFTIIYSRTINFIFIYSSLNEIIMLIIKIQIIFLSYK